MASFASLPAELRLDIYQLALVEKDAIEVRPWLHSKRGLKGFAKHNLLKTQASNSEFAAEACQFYLEHNGFFIPIAEVAGFVSGVSTFIKEPARWIRNVTIQFLNDSLLTFFLEERKRVLAPFTNLKKVHFDFEISGWDEVPMCEIPEFCSSILDILKDFKPMGGHCTAKANVWIEDCKVLSTNRFANHRQIWNSGSHPLRVDRFIWECEELISEMEQIKSSTEKAGGCKRHKMLTQSEAEDDWETEADDLEE